MLALNSFPFRVPLLRGGATNGEQWIFFVYSPYVRIVGGRLSCSEEFSIGEQLEGLPLILGLLTDWVCFVFSLVFFFFGEFK